MDVRRRLPFLLSLLGAAFVLLALFVVALTKDEPDDLPLRRGVLVAAGVACWIAAFVLADASGRRRGAVAAGALVVASGVAELIARWVLDDDAPVHRLSDVCLYEPVPGARKTYTRRSDEGVERIAFDVNSDGFRGPELRAPGGGRRVVVYGDSFVASMTTPIGDTFVARLRAALRPDVECVNAGVAGYGPDQALLKMETELPRLAPDLVVLAVCAQNDYGDLLRDHLLDVGEDGAMHRLRPTLAPEVADRFRESQTPSALLRRLFEVARRLHASMHGSPETRAWGRTSVDLDECRREDRRARDGVVVVDNLFADHIDADVRLEPSSDSARHKVVLMGKTLEAVRDATRAAKVPLAIVVIPSAWDACVGYGQGAVNLASHPEYRRDNLTRPIERIAEALGVAHVDLFDAFAATDANKLYWHGGDNHWNPAGQALAAELTARVILERGLLK